MEHVTINTTGSHIARVREGVGMEMNNTPPLPLTTLTKAIFRRIVDSCGQRRALEDMEGIHHRRLTLGLLAGMY